MTIFGYMALAFLFAQCNASNNSVITNEVTSDKELVLAFFVNRHGERTPDADEFSLSNEKEKLLSLSAIPGFEGLTNIGKHRAYHMGKFIRKRYGCQGLNLISKLYLQDEIAVRSTDKERTKMTAQMAMAAAYPPEIEQQWGEGLGMIWQPVPYTAVPLQEDYLRYYSNCKRFKALMAEAKQAAVHEELLPYRDLVPQIKSETGKDFTEDPLLFETLFDLFKSQVGLGLDIPEWAKPLMPRLTEAGRLAYRLYFRNDEMKRLGGGVLLNNFLEAAADIASGKPVTQRLRVFSGHDFNIGALMDVTKTVKERTIPEYGTAFALELYRSRSEGLFYVLPVYMNHFGHPSAEVLRIADCGPDYCDLDKFRELTQEFLLPEHEFYEICGIKTEL